MPYTLQRVLLLATLVSVIMFAGSSEAQDGSGKMVQGGSTGNGAEGVLPIFTSSPGESGAMGVGKVQVTEGGLGLISPMFWPFAFTIYEAFDFCLTTFVGQKLPCTIWSLAPPRMACTNLASVSK